MAMMPAAPRNVTGLRTEARNPIGSMEYSQGMATSAWTSASTIPVISKLGIGVTAASIELLEECGSGIGLLVGTPTGPARFAAILRRRAPAQLIVKRSEVAVPGYLNELE